MRLIYGFIFALLVPALGFGGSCPETITSATTFPCVMDSASTTYTLSENISCSQSCLFVAANNVTLNGNGKTLTFGASNNPGITDTVFEVWSDVNTLTNWTVTSGTVTRVASTWPEKTYDAQLSATGAIKSGNVTVTAGQTYVYYAIVQGSSSDGYTVGIYKASDNTELAATTISGATSYMLAWGYAAEHAYPGSSENKYTAASTESVYLKITASGSAATKRIVMADIKPACHYGIANHNYKSLAFPDNDASGLWGPSLGLTIQNLTIQQGAGQGVSSTGMYLSGDGQTGTISNVSINMVGRNTNAIFINPAGNLTLDTVSATTSSNASLNRQQSYSQVHIIESSTASGTVEIKNCTFLNSPGMTLNLSGANPATHAIQTNIHHNQIRPKEFVTNGYGIGIANIANVDVYYNTIQPYRGRGIITDTSGSSWSKNITIRYNEIKDLYELPLLEFDADNLEATGIRLRNWGDDPLQNIRVYGNRITGTADASGVHACEGIAINAYDPDDDIEIYDNTISVSATGTNREGIAIALQVADMSAGSYPLKIYNNTITAGTQSYAFWMGGADSGGAEYNLIKKLRIYNNAISSEENPFTFRSGYTMDDVDIYCNAITNSGTGAYPFALNGTLTDIKISNNSITNSNSGGFEVYAESDYSTGVTFCRSVVGGSLDNSADVTGGGTVGNDTDGTCQDGSDNCYSTAGSRYSGQYGHTAGLASATIGAGPHSWTTGGSGSITISP